MTESMPGNNETFLVFLLRRSSFFTCHIQRPKSKSLREKGVFSPEIWVFDQTGAVTFTAGNTGPQIAVLGSDKLGTLCDH